MSASKQVTKKELVPIQKEAMASQQQNVPLPFFGGERLIAARWGSPALNKVTEQTSSKKG